MRQPVFSRLREDKAAREVVREKRQRKCGVKYENLCRYERV